MCFGLAVQPISGLSARPVMVPLVAVECSVHGCPGLLTATGCHPEDRSCHGGTQAAEDLFSCCCPLSPVPVAHPVPVLPLSSPLCLSAAPHSCVSL